MFKSVAQVSITLTAGILLTVALVVIALGGTMSRAVIWAVTLALGARVIPILASFLIAYWPRRDFRVPQMGTLAMTRTVARELLATIKLYFFFHPFEKLVTRREPDRVHSGEWPIVLVHGFYSNAGFWHQLKKGLKKAGWNNLYCVNVEPPFAGIDHYAVQLQARIEEACSKCSTDSAIVVAHSMGGLVARACARRADGRMRHVICLGTPHEGTMLAALVPAENTRQMRLDSAWLRDLNDDAGSSVPITNIYSEHDNIVVPQSSATLSGAENIGLLGIGHLDMGFSSKLLNTLQDVLERVGPVCQLDKSP